MTKTISIFVYDKAVYKIAIKRWMIAESEKLTCGAELEAAPATDQAR